MKETKKEQSSEDENSGDEGDDIKMEQEVLLNKYRYFISSFLIITILDVLTVCSL